MEQEGAEGGSRGGERKLQEGWEDTQEVYGSSPVWSTKERDGEPKQSTGEQLALSIQKNRKNQRQWETMKGIKAQTKDVQREQWRWNLKQLKSVWKRWGKWGMKPKLGENRQLIQFLIKENSLDESLNDMAYFESPAYKEGLIVFLSSPQK